MPKPKVEGLSANYMLDVLYDQNISNPEMPSDETDFRRCIIAFDLFLNDHDLSPEIKLERVALLTKSCRSWEAIMDNYETLKHAVNGDARTFRYNMHSCINRYIKKDITQADYQFAQEVIDKKHAGKIHMSFNAQNALLILTENPEGPHRAHFTRHNRDFLLYGITRLWEPKHKYYEAYLDFTIPDAYRKTSVAIPSASNPFRLYPLNRLTDEERKDTDIESGLADGERKLTSIENRSGVAYRSSS